MSDRGGTALEKRQICILGDTLATTVAALADAQGHRLVDQPSANTDLIVVEADHLSQAHFFKNIPVLLIIPRRLRDSEVRHFLDQGATRVIDGESSILDVAFAFSDLLFGSCLEQRRYARAFGRLKASVCPLQQPGEKICQGQILGLTRRGAFFATQRKLEEGTRIELVLDFGARQAPVRGRIAYVSEAQLSDEGVSGMLGIEFSLGDRNVAPRLAQLLEPENLRAVAG